MITQLRYELQDCHLFNSECLLMPMLSSKISVDRAVLITILVCLPIVITMATLPLES